jgi:uncharacterized repeat protein (TIGR01451 family)
VTITFDATATASADTQNLNRNVGTATGKTIVNDKTLTAEDDAYVTVVAMPNISLEKQVWDGDEWLDADTATGPLLVSGPVKYRVIVTNTGTVTLTDVAVTDPEYAGTIALNDTTLAPGEWAVGEFEMTWAAGQQQNTATATGSYGGQSYTDTDDAFYYGATPSIQVTKEGPAEAEVGDVITYYFNVTTGTGNVPLSNVGGR